MSDAQPLPKAPVANPNGTISEDSVTEITRYIFGDLNSGSKLDGPPQQWGWLSHRPNSTGSYGFSSPFPKRTFEWGSNLLSVDSIRKDFDQVSVHRSDNSWHGKDNYFIKSGSWTPCRYWDNCEEKFPVKTALGKRGLFTFLQNNPLGEKQKEIPTYYASGPLFAVVPNFFEPKPPPKTEAVPVHTDYVKASDIQGFAQMGDNDDAIGLPSFGKEMLPVSKQISKFCGGFDSTAIGNMMKNTGLALSQSRSMIDEFSRRRIALEKDPTATGDKLEALMRAIPKDDKTLQDTHRAYTTALVNFNRSVPLSGNMQTDIDAMSKHLASPTLSAIEKDVARQILAESRLAQAHIKQVAKENTDESHKWFLEGGKLTADHLLALHGSNKGSWAFTMLDQSSGRDTLFYQDPEKLNVTEELDGAKGLKIAHAHVNTGWLWTARLAGFSNTELETLLDTNNDASGQTAENLSRAFRFIGTHFDSLSRHMMFKSDELHGIGGDAPRRIMYTNLPDLPRMAATLLTPQGSEMPETAAFLSTAFRAQFTQCPENSPARIKTHFALQHLFTALDNGSNSLNFKTVQFLEEPLKTGKYNNSLAQWGITRNDFNQLISLLRDDPSQTSVHPNRVSELYSHLKTIFDKHGSEGTLSKSNLQAIHAAIEINLDLSGPNTGHFSLLDNVGNAGTIDEKTGRVSGSKTHFGHSVVRSDDVPGYDATRFFYEQVQAPRKAVANMATTIALAPTPKPKKADTVLAFSPPKASILPVGFDTMSPLTFTALCLHSGLRPSERPNPTANSQQNPYYQPAQPVVHAMLMPR